MADGGRVRCFEDVDCMLFKDENRATVVVSTVIQLLQPPRPLCVNAQTCELGGSVRRESQRLMTTAMTAISTVIIPKHSRPPRATFRSRKSTSAGRRSHANPSRC